jgi:hypothetical protein
MNMSSILSSLFAMVGGHESSTPPGPAAGTKIVQPRTGILEDMFALTREPAVNPVERAAQAEHLQETNCMIPTPYSTTAAPALDDSVAGASAHTAHSTTSTPVTSALPTSAASTKRELGQFTESNWNHRCSEEQMLSDVSGRGAYTCTCRTGAALGSNLGCLPHRFWPHEGA